MDYTFKAILIVTGIVLFLAAGYIAEIVAEWDEFRDDDIKKPAKKSGAEGENRDGEDTDS